jgi:hypothetical protein
VLQHVRMQRELELSRHAQAGHQLALASRNGALIATSCPMNESAENPPAAGSLSEAVCEGSGTSVDENIAFGVPPLQ